jgi:predicted acyltransferase
MSKLNKERLISLDLFRGITMFLLLVEGTHLYYFLNAVTPENTILSKIAAQFLHADWNGMHFWDLIQPFFTFIIGVAMSFSLSKRWIGGESWFRSLNHILLRCFVLFFLGIMLQSVYRERLVWDLYNILTQLSVSIFIAFLLFRFPFKAQIIISLCLLFMTEMLYRNFSAEGFAQPFVKDHNFGTFIDLFLMGKTHPDGWTAINCIPTTAHVMWGVLTGNVLLSDKNPINKFRILVVVSLILLITGYGLDWTGVSPINKKISTASFVIASGGWTLMLFVFLYWLVDLHGYKRWVIFFAVVGMNPIFIYVFSRTIGRGFLNEFVPIFTRGFMVPLGLNEGIMNFTTFFVILGLEWYVCYWLYKKNIFIKI